jgi:predicted acetyltransferase
VTAERPPLTLRPVAPDDDEAVDAFFTVTALVFAAPHQQTPERREAGRDSIRGHRLTGAYEGDRLVGTYRSWDWQLTVPGGSVTADAVSSVTTLPTHRRRGVLTSLITRDLAEVRDRGVAAAVLIASEATIYGRFGFGPATQTATWTVDLRAARIAPAVPRGGSLELVSLAELRRTAPAVFEAARGPGATDRSPAWWDLACEITRMPGDVRGPRGAVLHRDPTGAPQGYLVYSWQDSWGDDRVSRTVATLHDLHAATPAAYAALWGYLTELDLYATVCAENRPVDEPLPWLLTDARAAVRGNTADMLWARVLDPVTALGGRRYEVPGRAVLEITDPLGHAASTVELQVDASGAAGVTPVRAQPDLTVPVGVLSSVWLGAGDLPAAAAAGRVIEHRSGAVPRVARMFRTLRAPWTGTSF